MDTSGVGRFQWRDFVCKVMQIWIPVNAGNFVCSGVTARFSGTRLYEVG